MSREAKARFLGLSWETVSRTSSGKFLRVESCYLESFGFLRLWILVPFFKADPVKGFLIVCHFKSMQCNTSILLTSMTGLKFVTASKTWNYKSRSKKTMPSSVYSCNNQFKSYMHRFSALCKFNFQLVMIECEIQPQNSSIHSILTSIL